MPIEKYGDAAVANTAIARSALYSAADQNRPRNHSRLARKAGNDSILCLSAEQAALYQRVVEESLAAIESAQGLQRRG